MGYYPVLDRAPKGRGEADGFQLWIRPYDEYESQCRTVIARMSASSYPAVASASPPKGDDSGGGGFG